MLERFKSKPSVLDDPIKQVLDDMVKKGPESQEYPALVEYLSKLVKLKSEERRKPLSADAILNVTGYITGILIIVAYEQKHVMVSKALGFVIRPKDLQT